MNSKLLMLLFLLFVACKSDNNLKQVNTSKATSVTEDKSLSQGIQEDLSKHGISDNPNNVLGGLKIGDRAPDFELENQDGELISLDEKLKEGPVLLVFYRADWCSICRKHLAEFQDRIKEIEAAGHASVLAVSPQKKEYSRKLSKENGYTFPILCDANHQTMKDYKVLFHVTDKYNQYIIEAKGESIEFRNGNKEPVMPVPATYMIGQDKRIKYVHYDPNYRVRADVDEALKSI